MPIVEPIIRPPSEARNFLLQVTNGCSQNSCTFCGAYSSKSFRVKPQKEIMGDILLASQQYPETRKVFLMDGDALVLNNNKLEPILTELNLRFPKLTRISSYANGINITSKTKQELKALTELKLTLLYMGLESGNQDLLNRCGKTSSVGEMVQAVQGAKGAGMKSSVIVLLGLGGTQHQEEHIRDTITALNAMQPKYLSFLSLMLIPGTPLFQEAERGGFRECSPLQLLEECYQILKGLDLESTIFRSNHASNYLPLEGRLPADKDRLLGRLEQALRGSTTLKPEFMRGL